LYTKNVKILIYVDYYYYTVDAQDCLEVSLALHELEGGPQFVHLELTALPEGCTQIRTVFWIGSGRIGIILADPDPYSFQPNVKQNYFFQKISIYCPKY
jgi:hypothetical protein